MSTRSRSPPAGPSRRGTRPCCRCSSGCRQSDTTRGSTPALFATSRRGRRGRCRRAGRSGRSACRCDSGRTSRRTIPRRCRPCRTDPNCWAQTSHRHGGLAILAELAVAAVAGVAVEVRLGRVDHRRFAEGQLMARGRRISSTRFARQTIVPTFLLAQPFTVRDRIVPAHAHDRMIVVLADTRIPPVQRIARKLGFGLITGFLDERGELSALTSVAAR